MSINIEEVLSKLEKSLVAQGMRILNSHDYWELNPKVRVLVFDTNNKGTLMKIKILGSMESSIWDMYIKVDGDSKYTHISPLDVTN